MRLFPENPYLDKVLWPLMGVFAALLFFVSIVILALLIRQRRYKGLWFALPELLFSYFLFQCISTLICGVERGPITTAIVTWFGSLPDWLILSFCVVLAIGAVLILDNIAAHGKSRITPMSVKEATDSLPAGLLCYAPGGQVLLINHAMEDFSRALTGDVVTDGESFFQKLRSGEFLPGNRSVTVFTEREMDVLRLLAEGFTDKEIADQLNLSVTTVRYHVNNLISKTGESSRTGLAVNAVRSGIAIPGIK